MFEKSNKTGFDHFASSYEELDGIVFCDSGAGDAGVFRLVKAWEQSLSGRVPVHSYKAGSWPRKPLTGRILYVFDYSSPEKVGVFDLAPFGEFLECGCLWIYGKDPGLPAQALEQESVDLVQAGMVESLLTARLARMRRHLLDRYRRWLLQQAVEHSSTSLCITDTNKKDNPLIYANPAFAELTGYPLEEVIGVNCRFLQGDEGTQESVDEIRKSMEEKRPCRVILKNFKKDGSVFWNSLCLTPVFDREGKPAYYVGIQKDVTKEIHSRDELRRSETRFRLLADSLPELVWATDAQGKWTFASRKLKQMLGFGNPEEGAELLKRLIQDPKAGKELQERLAGEKAFDLTVELGLLSGVRMYSINAAPWVDANGGLLGFVCCASDITDFSANARMLADRNRVLAAQLLIKQKILREEPFESICRETLEVMESLGSGRSFLLLPDEPLRSYGLGSTDAQSLSELLEDDELKLPETSLLISSSQPQHSIGVGLLQEWFGGDEYCFYTWEFSNGRQAALGIRREHSLGGWGRSQMDMVRGFGQMISMAEGVREERHAGGLEGKEILGRLPIPAAILSGGGEVAFENAAMRQLKKNHGPRLLKHLIEELAPQPESVDSLPGTKSLLRKVGEKTWLRLYLLPMPSGGETILLAQDISAQMEMENKVTQYKHIESLGRMRMEVQNEWSNTIGVLKLAMNSLKEEFPDIEAAHNFHILENAGVSLEGMFRQIHIYTGEGSLSLHNKDLNEWINGKRELFFQIWGPEINFDFVIKHGNFPVAMDDPCLTQAVQNLMVLLYPRVDANHPGFSMMTSPGAPETVELTLLAGSAFREGMTWEFKRHADSDSPSLEISAAILKAHGGSLMECRKSGEYYGFRLCLPIAREKEKGITPVEAQPLSMDSSMEVLIIEDNFPLLEIMRNCLENCGCRVQSASHAGEAHSLWDKYRKQIQFCIVDVNLPGGESGVELIKSMRKQNPRLPALFTSGFDRHEVINRFGLEEGELLLAKPFSREELVEKLRQIMKQV